jgi:N-methylhydantoinase B
MTRQQVLPDFVREHHVDRITLDIIEHALKNIRFEMDRVLVTTAVSPVIREQADEFPLIADRKGRMVIGQFGSAINTILHHSPYTVQDLREGDVIATNDPYMMEGSTSHLPDILLLRPIFYEGDLVGYASQWGNLMDVGGTSPGSIPIDAQSIYEEGIRMPPVKLYERGILNKELLRMFCHNTRMPEVVEADIKAIAAGVAVGSSRIKELCERFGKDNYLEALDAILDRSRSGLIQLIRKYIPEGERFDFEDFTDDDGRGHGPIRLKLAMWREGDHLHLDWTGTSDQVAGPVNFLLNPEMFKMFAGVFLIMAFDPTITFNDGFYDLIHVIIPEGSVLRPRFPAPLSNRLVVMARHFDVLQAVFGKAIGTFKVSGSYGTSPNLVYSGIDKVGKPFQILEILYGGIPARPGSDGLDGHTWWPEFYSIPTEYLEKYYPLMVESYRVRPESSGAGEYRGGCGVSKTYTFLADGAITFQDDRAHTYPYGVNGGKSGGASRKVLLRENGKRVNLPSKVRDVPVCIGDQLIFETAGAGGLGDPMKRDPAKVVTEVHRGLCTKENAWTSYAVKIKDDGQIDEADTRREREKRIANQEGQLAPFDLGPVPSPDVLQAQIAETYRVFKEWLGQEEAGRKI